jgi:acetyl-CoA acyltransferase
VGPIAAARKLTLSGGITLDKLDVIALNGAIATLREVDIDPFHDPRVNHNQGSIALGRPLGMSGARITMNAVDNQRPANGEAAT